MKTLKLLPSLLGQVLLATPAWAASPSELITGPTQHKLCQGRDIAGCGRTTLDNNGYLVAFINVFIYVAAIVAIIFVIIGGIRFITSDGNPTLIEKAKNTILYAIIGLGITILARIIIAFVIGEIKVS